MYIDKNLNRFNPAAVIVHKGAVYNGNVLQFPDVVSDLGITEIPDPQPPADYSEETYFRTEQDAAPYVVYTRKSDDVINAARKSRTDELRATAYRIESDPLFFKEQRGEVPTGTWLAKVREIKERYPDVAVA